LNRIPLVFTISILVLGLIPFYAADAVPPASTLYMISKGDSSSDPSQLWTVDSSTGDAHPLPNPVGLDACTSTDFHPSTRILYAACERDIGSTNILATINTNTGVGTEIGVHTPPSGGENYGGMSFRAEGSPPTLFAFGTSNDELGTMDINTGVFTDFAGPGTKRPGNAIAWTLDSGTLYRAGANPGGTDTIDTLNPVTGAVMSSQNLDYSGVPLEEDDRVVAMDYDPDTGLLWAAIRDLSTAADVRDTSAYLATIDPSNGVVANAVLIVDAYVVTNAVIGVDGIAWLDEIPVGGELLPINTTALLIAGLQLSAVWLIPFAVSAIGIGAVLIRKKISF